MYKLLIFSLLCCSMNSWSTPTPLNIDVNAESALLINAETGVVIYEKNADQIRFPASTTKIATGIYALQQNRQFLDRDVVAEWNVLGTVTEEEKQRGNYKKIPSWRLVSDGSHIGIKTGEKLPLRVLLYGLMIGSGNDAANVIAHYTSGSIEAFMDELNTFLKQCGCQHTHFNNPHGLFHPEHVTTARDLAILTRVAMKDPFFREIVRTTRYARPATNKQESSTMVQTNRLLRQGDHYYKYAIGVKTGFISAAKNNLVAAAEKQGRTLIAVVLGCKARNDTFSDAKKLFEAAYNEPLKEKILVKTGRQNVQLAIPGVSHPITTYVTDPVKFQFYLSEEPKLKAWLVAENITPPIRKGEKVGEIRFTNETDRVVAAAPLLAADTIRGSLWYRFKRFLSENHTTWKYLAFACLPIGCLLLGVRLIRRQ